MEEGVIECQVAKERHTIVFEIVLGFRKDLDGASKVEHVKLRLKNNEHIDGLLISHRRGLVCTHRDGLRAVRQWCIDELSVW